MDIREYWEILKKNARLFWVVTLGLWLLSAVWLVLQPTSYQGVLLLNIGRTAGEPAGEYSYDNFYRLQADERFADTIVRWLANPRIVTDILVEAGSSPEQYSEKALSSQFHAKRLSSQVVEVRFAGATRDVVQRYSEAITQVTQTYTESLNANQGNWFRVVGSDPVVRDARVPAWPFLAMSFFVAVFIALWVVLFKHYFAPESPLNT